MTSCVSTGAVYDSVSHTMFNPLRRGISWWTLITYARNSLDIESYQMASKSMRPSQGTSVGRFAAGIEFF